MDLENEMGTPLFIRGKQQAITYFIQSIYCLSMMIGAGMTAVISQCIDARDYRQTKFYAKKIMVIIYVAQIVMSASVLFLFPVILEVYQLSSDAAIWTIEIVWSHAIALILIWPLGNTLPLIFRSAGDTKFPMAVSMITIITCRIALAYIFIKIIHFSVLATWFAIYCDWTIKGIIFFI